MIRPFIGMAAISALLAALGCEAPGEDRARTRDAMREEKPWTKQHRLRQQAPPAERDAFEDRALSGFEGKAQEAARVMIARYGRPDEASESRLIWHGKGPWKELIVYREEVRHEWPMPHTDVLESVIPYRVPADRFDDLAMFDGSVIAERTKGTLAARCDKEEMNFLALNLANDIVEGKKSVEEARRFYEETAKAFKEGKKHETTQKLLFRIPTEKTGDADAPAAPRD